MYRDLPTGGTYLTRVAISEKFPDNPRSVAFSQRANIPRLIEHKTFNDSDVINNLIDYKDGQEEPNSSIVVGYTLSQTQAFERHRHFREGRESVEDDERTGCPQTSRTTENIEKVSAEVPSEYFQNMAHYFQGRRFQFADEIKSTSQAELNDMAKNVFQKCFDDLHKRQNCVVVQESYFKGGFSNFLGNNV
ncbi:hypothetical protein TNCV_93471 [Trichonephila clavipes]|nr:hypothetical protein TNCV_93471 [Trichonephila clavipes]